MTSFEVGVTRITQHNGSTQTIDSAVLPRDLLRRVADGVPYVRIGASGCELQPAPDLYARAIAEVIREQPNVGPENQPIALAVPGWWTPRALNSVKRAFVQQQLNVMLFNDAEAAVTECQYQGLTLPETVAVVQLRAGQTSVVIVRNCTPTPKALISPIQVHNEGGESLDTAVLQHLVRGLEDVGETVDKSQPHTIAAAREALNQSRTLREALSVTSAESIVLDLPGVEQRMRLVRSELEELAAPWSSSVIDAVATAIGQCAHPIYAVLLTGGLAPMPLISQRVSADLALEVFVPKEPHLVAARGAERMRAAALTQPRRRFSFWRKPKSQTSENLGTTQQQNTRTHRNVRSAANIKNAGNNNASTNTQPLNTPSGLSPAPETHWSEFDELIASFVPTEKSGPNSSTVNTSATETKLRSHHKEPQR